MIKEVKLRVDSQLEPILLRLQDAVQDAFRDAFTERPEWANEVATSEALRQDLKTVLAAIEHTVTKADLAAVRESINRLPTQAASPGAVAEIMTAVEALPKQAASPESLASIRAQLVELATTLDRCEKTATQGTTEANTASQNGREALVGLQSTIQDQGQLMAQVFANLEASRIEQGSTRVALATLQQDLLRMAEIVDQNQKALTSLMRPWYRRIFS